MRIFFFFLNRLGLGNSSATENLKFLSPTKVIQDCLSLFCYTQKADTFSLLCRVPSRICRNNAQNSSMEFLLFRGSEATGGCRSQQRQLPTATHPTSLARSQTSAPTLTAAVAINLSGSQTNSSSSINFLLEFFAKQKPQTQVLP